MKSVIIQVLAGGLAIVFFLAAEEGIASSLWFAIITLILIAYVGFEIYACAKEKSAKKVLVIPSVIISLLYFGISYGISNVTFYTMQGNELLDFLDLDLTWMCRTEALALWGAVSMWVGYRSRVGVSVGNLLRRFFRIDRFVSQSWELRWSYVWILLLTSLGMRLFLIRLGQFGISKDIDKLTESQSYYQFLVLIAGLGRVVLLALAIHCVGYKNSTPSAWVMFYGVFLCEMFFGLISGYKNPVVFPSLMVTIVYYIVRGKIPKLCVASVLVSIILAYFFVEPFRRACQEDPALDNRSLSSLTVTLAKSPFTHDKASNEESVVISAASSTNSRLNLTATSALAIKYKDTQGLSNNSPPFLQNLVFSPIYSVIPRFVMPDKPVENIGGWFSQEVYGSTEQTAIALGPIGHLYLVGGVFGVCIGFMSIGFVQRLLFQLFWKFGGGSLFVYLGALGSISAFESTVDIVFISLIRIWPALVVCQLLLYKNSGNYHRNEIKSEKLGRFSDTTAVA